MMRRWESSDYARHFSNWCDMHKETKVVHKSWSYNHCNRSPVHSTTTALLANALFPSLSRKHTHIYTQNTTHTHTQHTHTHREKEKKKKKRRRKREKDEIKTELATIRGIFYETHPAMLAAKYSQVRSPCFHPISRNV